MTDYGVIPTGFRRKTFDEARTELQARVRVLCGEQLELDDLDPIGALVHASAEQCDALWQVGEAAYNGFDRQNAESAQLDAIGALTGVPRLAAQAGECDSVTVNLDASKTYAPGALIAHVTGAPTNRWLNRDTVTSTTAGDYEDIVFVSEGTGALYTAPAGSLTVIAQRVAGWNSVTNVTDALPGKDTESDDDYRVRQDESIGIQGSASTSGIRADVAAVEGVIQVRVYENNTDVTVGVLPPHSCRVVVWDDSPTQANDDEIAQAIFDSKAAGITPYGSLSGEAIDANGTTVAIAFDRATVVPLYCDVTVVAPAGTNSAAVKTAIQSKVPTTIGSKLVFISAKSAPLAVAGVTDVSVFKLDDIDPPVNTTDNLVPTDTQIYLLDTGDINVTVVAS